MSKSGTDSIRLISQLEFQIQGLGQAYLNPYGFISGSQYTIVKGEAGSGNERGVATARDGETVVTYTDIDFGVAGSDEITVPVFALTGEEYPIQIWEGVPGEEGSSLVADVVYQKPSVWNVYQPETWKLNKFLKGITSVSFSVRQKIHIKVIEIGCNNFCKDEICCLLNITQCRVEMTYLNYNIERL
jgi:beta-galactosidase